MKFSEIIRTALHSLRINPIRSALSVIGVVFGIGAVIALISIGQGVRIQITDQIKGLGTDLLIINSGKAEANDDALAMQSGAQLSTSTLTEPDAKVLAEVKGVDGATGTIEQYAKIESGESSVTEKVIGGDKSFQKVRKISFSQKDGDWSLAGQESGTCAVGTHLVERLLNVSPSEALGKTVRIGQKDFTIKAVTKKKAKSFFADPNREIYIPLADARELFGGAGTEKVQQIYVKSAEASGGKELQANMEEKLAAEHREKSGTDNWEMDFYISTQEDLMASYDKIIGILNALVIGIAAIALIESGIGVSNIMYISVKERTREIGVRLAQGASKRTVLIQFLTESVVLCVLGALIGVPFGWLLAAFLDAVSDMPAATPLWSIFLAFGVATLVGVIAGMYPAWKATKSDIAVVLRAE